MPIERCVVYAYRREIDLKVRHVICEKLVIRLEELHFSLAETVFSRNTHNAKSKVTLLP